MVQRDLGSYHYQLIFVPSGLNRLFDQFFFFLKILEYFKSQNIYRERTEFTPTIRYCINFFFLIYISTKVSLRNCNYIWGRDMIKPSSTPKLASLWYPLVFQYIDIDKSTGYYQIIRICFLISNQFPHQCILFDHLTFKVLFLF